MRTIYLLAVLFLSVSLAYSCVSDPHPPAPTEPPAQVQADPPPPPTVQPPPPPADPYNRHPSGVILDGARQYTVQEGDTLAGIAWRFYDDGCYYPLIMLVSDDVGADPDEIEPGMGMIIPPLEENLNDARARASINRSLSQMAAIEEQRGRRETASLMRSHAN